jgi:putative transposase
MCELAQVSRASFYRHWEQTAPSEAEMALRDAVQRAAIGNRYYGYRRIQKTLEREGIVVGIKKVRRLMRDDNLLAVRRRKFVRTTETDHRFRVHPNLARYLELTAINQLWVADFTYVRLAGEFVYVAVIVDAYSRRAIGWAVGRMLDTQLGLRALNHAIAQRQPLPGLVHHSDRGSQYASEAYVARLTEIGAVLSMSRPARPWENGICESLIKTLKKEEIDARVYRDLAELEANVTEFLEQIYNQTRLHSALGYQSPAEFEQRLTITPWRPATLSFPRHEEIYQSDNHTVSSG